MTNLKVPDVKGPVCCVYFCIVKAMAETVKQCQLCNLKTNSMSFLLKHLTAVHSSKPGFLLTCSLNGCQKTFQNITTYKHHVYAKHPKNHTNMVISAVCDGEILECELCEDQRESCDCAEVVSDEATSTQDIISGMFLLYKLYKANHDNFYRNE